MARANYNNDGYYETNPDAIETGPGIPPTIQFEPTTPLANQLIREGSFIGIRYYLHPKLGDAYRYKYSWKGSKWWLDVTLDGLGYHLWAQDGQAFMETKESADEARSAPPPEPKPAPAKKPAPESGDSE